MNDWRTKSAIYQGLALVNPNALDSDIQQLNVAVNIQNQIKDVLASYRIFLPPAFEQGYVPLAKILTPQKSVIVERARACFGGATNRLTTEETAKFCLGTPIAAPAIDVKLLNVQPQAPNQIAYVCQFSAFDDDIRPIPPNVFQPFSRVDWAVAGAPHSLKLNSVCFTVGPGTSPVVMIIKIPIGVDPQGRTIYRLVLQNGVHRVFRLAELGNTHVAAIVHTLNLNEVPQPLVDTPREALVIPRPLMISDFVNASITQSFAWERVKLVWKLVLTSQQERFFA
jgi:hypothetical protein